ncbi:hypothetical protein DNH61_25965 [Paenibacillus sambharensis]|uniref:LiaF transmembrane domain-containing protein n=1 Tax=Paenibacillus sambharensis TaxID=1803190 RepID=A0A2W1L226_9BACL|nr:hypothetical protein [Paenibacillus sambharensis]PZD92939.1 hypothetical protein DNH61_25965 [Paenibacillus sambharensis]
MNSKTAIGAVLVFCGGWLVLRIFGFSLGPIFGLIFPFILIGLGILGMKNDKKIIGAILLTIGLISLLAKLSGLIMLLIAIALIVGGVSLFKNKNRAY